jgi:glucosamine 6-phosphate synthetase-like amidotransferase/phosphosugar isomerase protein
MDELEQGYRFREPAEATRQFMTEQIKFNQQMKLDMHDMKNDIKNICNQMAENNEQNREEHRAIMSRLGRIEKFALGTLMIFALASLYYLFTKAGLPTP